MIPRKYRATRVDIENTIRTGITLDSPTVYAKVSRKTPEKTGFAIVISKKVEKTSAGRHLIKRRMSDVIEKNLDKIKPDLKKTVVIFAKKSEKVPSYSDIKKVLESILTKII
ncbi:MAG: ribonuclease P protein component [Candidatus Paceibacterota bacterium]|jgi:ribonuclease P protein component